MLRAILVLAIVSLPALSLPAVAQVGNGQRGIMTEMPRPVMQSMRDWLRNRATTDAPEFPFKVPAISIEVRCNLNAQGIQCFESLIALQCPREVTVQLPGGGTQTVPVSCTGPDGDGNCDCEFTDRG